MSTAPLPDYYAVLEVREGAPMQEIRGAYMRQASPPSNPKPRPESIKSTNNPPPSAALASHPDGIPLDSSEEEHDTLMRRYHLINDAYYNLSDATRRTHYDAQRRYSALSTQEAGAFEEAEEISQQPGGTGEANGDDDQRLREDAQFKDVFEGEMRENNMAEDGTNMPKTAFWSLIGGVTGGTLAFLITGPPGIPAGMVIGSTAGKIRDARGKSVYEVYKLLDHEGREDMLHELQRNLFSPFAGE
ncbi:Heat shock protein DnaJ, partial [Metarhizium majus ARSEF 297]